jgi:hypothetical protein
MLKIRKKREGRLNRRRLVLQTCWQYDPQPSTNPGISAQASTGLSRIKEKRKKREKEEKMVRRKHDGGRGRQCWRREKCNKLSILLCKYNTMNLKYNVIHYFIVFY